MPASAQLLVLLAAVALFWVLVMRPTRTQQRAVRQLQSDLAVGDEVVISSGIFGTVREIDDAKVRLEVAPGVVLSVARQVVVRRVEDVEDPAPAGEDTPMPDPTSDPRPDQTPSDAAVRDDERE